MTDMRLRLGDVVTCVVNGVGEVNHIGRESDPYPVSVRFEEHEQLYTLDGRLFQAGRTVLFKGKVKLDVVLSPKRTVAILPTGDWCEVIDASEIVYLDVTTEQITQLSEASDATVRRLREAHSDEDVARILDGENDEV